MIVYKNKNKYNIKYVWERAVLTKGDYLIDSSSWRKNLLTTEKNARDFSWKRFLRFTDEHKQKRQFIKQVFDDDLFDKNNLPSAHLEFLPKEDYETWKELHEKSNVLTKEICLIINKK